MSTTYDFWPSLSTDMGNANRTTGSTDTPVWPPNNAVGVNSLAPTPARVFSTLNVSGSPLYSASNQEAIIRFNTSSLPDDAVIISATLTLPVSSQTFYASDAPRYLVVEYYSFDGSLATSDYADFPGGGAYGTTGTFASFTGLLVNPGQTTYTLTLTSPTSIARNGYTGFRISIQTGNALIGSNLGSSTYPAMPPTTGQQNLSESVLTFKNDRDGTGPVLTVVTQTLHTLILSASLAPTSDLLHNATVTQLLTSLWVATGDLVSALTVLKLLSGSLTAAGSVFTDIANVAPVRAILTILTKYDAKFSVRSKLAALLRVRPND